MNSKQPAKPCVVISFMLGMDERGVGATWKVIDRDGATHRYFFPSMVALDLLGALTRFCDAVPAAGGEIEDRFYANMPRFDPADWDCGSAFNVKAISKFDQYTDACRVALRCTHDRAQLEMAAFVAHRLREVLASQQNRLIDLRKDGGDISGTS